jgi:hypothetical protein
VESMGACAGLDEHLRRHAGGRCMRPAGSRRLGDSCARPTCERRQPPPDGRSPPPPPRRISSCVPGRRRQPDGGDAERVERLQLALIGDGIAVRVLPHDEIVERRVAGVDDAVGIAVVERQLGKAGDVVVPEQLRHVVDQPVGIKVDGEQPVIAVDPAGRLGEEIAVHVEEPAGEADGGELQPVAVEVEHQRIDAADAVLGEEVLQRQMHEGPQIVVRRRGDAFGEILQPIGVDLDAAGTDAGGQVLRVGQRIAVAVGEIHKVRCAVARISDPADAHLAIIIERNLCLAPETVGKGRLRFANDGCQYEHLAIRHYQFVTPGSVDDLSAGAPVDDVLVVVGAGIDRRPVAAPHLVRGNPPRARHHRRRPCRYA